MFNASTNTHLTSDALLYFALPLPNACLAETASASAVLRAAELTARAETQQCVGRAVLALEESLRETVLLRYFEGLSAAEIARRTGTPAGTVRWRLKRGLEELRHTLDEEHGDRRAWCLLLLPLAREPLYAAQPRNRHQVGDLQAT